MSYYEQQERKNTEFVVSATWTWLIIAVFVLLCFAIKGCYCFSVHSPLVGDLNYGNKNRACH